MIKELCVIGHPSKLGGADTELEHQIYLWVEMGIKVYICHTGGFDENLKVMQKELTNIGCEYLPSRSWSDLNGLHTISFCNGEFLNNLEEIKKYSKSTTFVNCMTWNFDKEIEAQKKNLIDFHLYQTKHQYDRVSPKLIEANKNNYKPIFFNPYFKNDDFPFIERNNDNYYKFGRISRGDADKFSSQQLWIWETMTAPVMKIGTVLGWDHRAEKKLGKLPEYVRGYPEGAIMQQSLYRECDVIIMSTDTYENLPRVGFEAMSSGSVLIVDNKGGWQTLVEDGKTGWLCADNREFAYKASRAAFEKEETKELRHAARQKLENEWGKENSMKSWENVFNEWGKI